MATQMTVFNPAANLPAYAKKAAPSALALALAGGQSSGKRISVKGGVFRLVSGGKEVTAIDDRYLDVVIIAAAQKISRTFYAKVFDENAVTAPDCWSPDGDAPDASVKTPQGGTCAACPKNVKGSGQGESKACRYSQRLAVVLANDMEGDVMQLTLAATSIFGKAEGDNRPLQEYARYLVAQGIDPSMLVTRMRFDTTAAVPKLFFKPMRWLTEEEFAGTSALAVTPEAIQAVTYTVFQQDTPAPAPKPAAKPTPVPAPEPDADDEPPPPPPKAKRTAAKPAPVGLPDDEPVPEPAKKPAAKPVAPASAAGLAATLAEWDDE